MKILIDLTSLDDNFSGIERYALNISKQMLIQDNKNSYILVFKNRIHKEFEEFNSTENIEIKIIKGKNKLIFNQIILPYYLYKFKCDKYLFLAFPSPILFRKEGIINTIHDLTCWDYPETMKFLSKQYFKISIKNSIRISEKILTVSNFSMNRILNKFKNCKKIQVVYNGVSQNFVDFEKNKKNIQYYNQMIDLPENYILCLGTLEPRKNLKLLIKAFIEVKKYLNLNYKLLIVGREGWKNSCIMDGVSDEFKRDIIFTGFIDDELLPYIYSKASLFVFPSIYEGFGLPIIEAMSVGTNILYSDIDVMKEITYGIGNSFKSNDKEDLKNKIINILNDCNFDKRDILLEQSKKFRWNTEAKKIINLCDGE